MVSGSQEAIDLGKYRTRIGVMTSNLDKSTSVSYGISKGDESTISANNGILSVNTQNLQYFTCSLLSLCHWLGIKAEPSKLH